MPPMAPVKSAVMEPFCRSDSDERVQAPFVHVRREEAGSESRYRLLNAAEPAICRPLWCWRYCSTAWR